MGAITPNYSITGNRIQDLEDSAVDAQYLAFGTDIGTRGISIVFLWNPEAAAPSVYINELLNLPRDLLPQFLCQFFFTHCENTYFSPRWWKTLPTRERQTLELMARNYNPYFRPPEYSYDLLAVPWEFQSFRMSAKGVVVTG